MHHARPGLAVRDERAAPQVGQHRAGVGRVAMAAAAKASVLSAALGNLLGCTGCRRWVERRPRDGRPGWKPCAAAQPVDEQSRHIADGSSNLGEDAGGQRPYAAPARQHGNVLLTLDRIGDGGRGDAGLHAARPEFRAAHRIVGRKLLGRVALEHEPAARRQYATVPRPLEGHAPALLLGNGVPGYERSPGCRHHGSTDLGIGGHRGRRKVDTRIEALRRFLPMGFGHIRKAGFLRRDIDEPRPRVIGHGLPAVRATRSGYDHERLARLVDARLGILDGPSALGIDTLGPVDRDITRSRDQLSGCAVEHIKETVLRRLHHHRARPAVDLEVRENHVLSGVEVPRVARCGLVVPDVLAGPGLQRDDRVNVEIVAAAGRAIGLVPGTSIAHPDIEQVELGVIRHRIPHGPAATERPPVALPGGLGAPQMRRCIGARPVRDGVEAPESLSVVAVVRRHIAAYAHLPAGVTDDHPAVDHARRAGDCIRLGSIHGQLRPDQPSGLSVERDQSAIQRSEVQAPAPGGEAPVDDVAADPNARFARHLGIVFPAQLPRERVVSLHFGPGGRDVDGAVNDEGGCFLSARRVQVREPGETQILHVRGVDPVERREALLVIGTAMGQPVLEIVRRRDQSLAVHRAGCGRMRIGHRCD